MRALHRVIALFCLLPALALANGMEVITLQNRSANEVLPALRPLLEPGGVLTGINDQIILRASSANRAQIKAALAALDKPVRQLLIYVSQHRQQNSQQHELAVASRSGGGDSLPLHQPISGRDGVTASVHGGSSAADVRLDNRQHNRAEQVGQILRVADGGRAYIQAGVSLPMRLHQVYLSPSGAIISDSTVYRDIGSGFYATPHLNGRRVTLEISPQLDSPAGNGAINVQRLSTTITTRLGEWTQLGAADTRNNQQNKALPGHASGNNSTQGNVWVKVEETPQ
ncbi:secretin [Sulfuriferula plumbiphila]|uniref:Secretin n=1 Tax=Sulfuriferula plumbiphila TaxID=171865 RepID=A0A512LAM4_9PROT|nr:secretin N-terminal domain-containing protein [Sulfuriferula plumbiphila]BBP03388.1 secretin [Sulfuriferula plumbiphila]GEP31530.1 secretin [Sulfuriferula plumbiphila]